VLLAPAPVCHITGFGDSAVNLVLRFWIDDPVEGVTNIKGDVYLSLWETFKEHGVEIPFPQRDLHLRTVPAEMRANAAGAEGDGAFQPETAQQQRVADDQH
jgi:potassium efflux system protein